MLEKWILPNSERAVEQPTYTRISTVKLFRVMYLDLLLSAIFYTELSTSLKQGP